MDYLFDIFPQTYGAEAGPESAIQPMEETGMSDEVLQKVRIWIFSINLTQIYSK